MARIAVQRVPSVGIVCVEPHVCQAKSDGDKTIVLAQRTGSVCVGILALELHR